jgi:hypothetical protein
VCPRLFYSFSLVRVDLMSNRVICLLWYMLFELIGLFVDRLLDLMAYFRLRKVFCYLYYRYNVIEFKIPDFGR